MDVDTEGTYSPECPGAHHYSIPDHLIDSGTPPRASFSVMEDHSDEGNDSNHVLYEEDDIQPRANVIQSTAIQPTVDRTTAMRASIVRIHPGTMRTTFSELTNNYTVVD
jgi:hypothetical protein